MNPRIQKLQNRLITATADRIMVEVRRRARNFGLKVSPRYLAAAERQVVHALSEAERRYPEPVNITLSRVLARHFLTGGIVHFNEDDILRYIRLAVLKHHPQRREIFRVEREIKQGRPVEPSRLKSAQDAFYFLPAEQARKWGISHNIYDVLDGSFFNCLIRAFPLLGLAREGFKVKSWSTPEQAIRNVRFGILRADPELEKEALEVEGLIAAKQPIDPRRLTRLRAQLLGLGGRGVQSRVGGFRRSGFFADAEDALRQGFPLLKLPSSDRFLAGFDLADKEDLRRLLLLALSRAGLASLDCVDVGSPKFLRPLDLRYGDQLALRSILKRVREVFCETWEVGKCLAKSGRRLKRREFRQWLQELVLDFDTHEKVVLEFLYILQNRRGNPEDIIKMNSRYIARYGTGVILDLFGVDLRTFLRRSEFKGHQVSRPKNTLPKMLAISDKVAIMEGEVTAGLFRRIMQGYEITGDGADNLRAMLNDPSRAAEPLTYTSLVDGRALARRLSKHTGRRFRVMAWGDWDLALDNKVRQKMSGYHWNWTEEESSPGSGFYQLYSLVGGSKTSLPDFRYPDSAIRLVEDL
ncbi:MAG: hypothetical protein WC645_02035 [Candidatus Margulisiibacteriota bacterium]